MFLPQTKEREHRFILAIRMVLPIFLLLITYFIYVIFSEYQTTSLSFFISLIFILIISIYFTFFLIYNGLNTKIIDNISGAFNREYMYDYLNKQIKKEKIYTLILINIDNISEINSRYGINNGDKILSEMVIWINKYISSKNINNFPIGHMRGSSFIIGLKGKKDKYKSILELMCLKSEDFKIDDIEIQISGSIVDTVNSTNLDELFENLFEMQSKNRESKTIINLDENIPQDYDLTIKNALENKNIVITSQKVYQNNQEIFEEVFIKLKDEEGKILHPKNYLKILDKLRIMSEYDLLAIKTVIKLSQNQKSYALQISPTTLRNNTYFYKIKELIKDKNLKLIFIISENEYYQQIDRFNNILQELRELGIKIAIDRVGLLNTSFLYFKNLKVDMIRFSSSLVKDIDDGKNLIIIDGFCKMAKSVEVFSWVKLVEDEQRYKKLEKVGLDFFQGKFLANIKEEKI